MTRRIARPLGRFAPAAALVVLAAHLVAPRLAPAAPQPAADPAPARAAVAPRGIAGPGVCALDAVNADADQAAVGLIELFRHGGAQAPLPLVLPPMPALRHATLDLGALPQVQPGAWAAIVSSDRTIGVIRRCAWPMTGGAMAGAAAAPGTELVAPIVRDRARGETALMTMQNTDTSAAATVLLEVLLDGMAPALALVYTVNPGGAITVDTGREPEFAALPDGGPGSVVLRSTSVLAADLIVDFEASARGVADVAFQRAEDAAATIVAPRVRRGADGDGTRLQVVNPGRADLEARARVVGTAGACAGQAYDVGPVAVAARDMTELDLASSASGLPEGCAASAVVTATAGVLVTALETAGPGRDAAAYAAAAPSAAHPRLYAVRWTAADVAGGTVLDLFNPGPEAADVTLEPLDPAGQPVACRAGCALAVPAGAGVRVASADLDTDLAPASVGALLVASTAPLAGVLGEGGPGSGRDLQLGALVAVDVAPGMEQPIAHVPLVVSSDTPLATPVPVPTGGAVPSATPDLATPTDPPSPTPTATTPPPPPPTVGPTSTVAMPTATSAAASTATALPAGGPRVAPGLAGRVPPAALAAALADPSRVAGWDQPCHPGIPEGPRNGRRRTLRLLNPAVPFHPLFNPLVFACG